ncbi:DUF3139 domain-containing protein [Bacillus pseudomycoides]|uniref:DUF3139 domain-containing protein n=1 Tax=Bacillus pseudomycoides TaxID=64104 RepID=UPI0002D5C692|nr:DUF3139 domain-containing protein [Bacillus pseudomycoides]PEJ18404.1 DUF3139 domain-containing protein [Bacillus pseudomycoides]PEP86903.1 DUF3139 domain-containing protein [Bacillus pseudomycoides]PGD79884.1 DUF3139 domain-containing protein [Bacillus pseudomycoides]PGF08794.1 DUF3139 domain-containing protein [Bacillus pseudomycoides]PHG38285.1 DUF3139 domain-containing protein [Bacillus pseudomycoides]
MKKIICILILMISLILNIKTFVYDKYVTVGEPEKREEAIIAIMWHLQSKGYKESDILSIEPAFYSKIGLYGMNVQFKDEPNESYTYRIRKDLKTNKLSVFQDSNARGGMGGKHQELK